MTGRQSTEPGPYRVLPLVTDLNGGFWQGGAEGELRFRRCQQCGEWLHPPSPVCRACRSTETRFEPVSGRGTVATFSVNHHQWSPEATEEPYVVAIVDLPEQADLRVITNIVGCPVRDVRIGMPVRVTFEQMEDVWLPLFEPDRDLVPDD